MPYLVKTESGSTIRVAMPRWIAQKKGAQWVDTQKNLTAEQKKEFNAPILILNEKNQYKFVPRHLADRMIDEYRAVEIAEDDPEYVTAFEMALGRPKDHVIISGDAIPYERVGTKDFEKEIAKVKAAREGKTQSEVSEVPDRNKQDSFGLSKNRRKVDEDED